eukprot:3117302-Prymnesium_polylepis.1
MPAAKETDAEKVAARLAVLRALDRVLAEAKVVPQLPKLSFAGKNRKGTSKYTDTLIGGGGATLAAAVSAAVVAAVNDTRDNFGRAAAKIKEENDGAARFLQNLVDDGELGLKFDDPPSFAALFAAATGRAPTA